MADRQKLTGIIFDIKRFAVHDGPGIRTTVFLKGCPLRCVWCHNPEGFSARPELVLYEDKCIGCRECVAACPRGARAADASGGRIYRRELCVRCGHCADVCYAGALVLQGREAAVEETLRAVSEDAIFFRQSGGGVTFSGGEPLLQHKFLAAVLQGCCSVGIHTAVDTCGHVPWEAFEAVHPFTDLFLYDLKHMDPARHQEFTGASNELLIENLRRLSEQGVPIEIRMPIIPGANDSRESVCRAAEFAASLDNVAGVRLLPYLRLSQSKYHRLGLSHILPMEETPDRERMNEIAGWVHEQGLKVV